MAQSDTIKKQMESLGQKISSFGQKLGQQAKSYIKENASSVGRQIDQANARKSTGMESWRFNTDGTRKSFDQLSNSEALTWIGTLAPEKQEWAKQEFETNYLKNPGSRHYDPYYTNTSNNDEARSLFGVDTFDQHWIDSNRQYLNYLTFSDESYDSPKKPGKNATELEKAAYQYWQIANTYEATTQAAESEYAKLRQEIKEKVAAAKAMGEAASADELLAGIDWSEYKTLENLRDTAKAGNGRYLNRPVQVGEESLRAMVNAAIRGEDVTDARDYLMAESDWLKSEPERMRKAGEEAWSKIGPKVTEAISSAVGRFAGKDEETQARADGEAGTDATEGLVDQRNAATEKEIQVLQTKLGGLQRAIEIGRISDQQRKEYLAEIESIKERLYGSEKEPVKVEPKETFETKYSLKPDEETQSYPGLNAEISYMMQETGVEGAVSYIEKKIGSLETYRDLGMLDGNGQKQLEEYQKQLGILRGETEQVRPTAEQQAVEYRAEYGFSSTVSMAEKMVEHLSRLEADGTASEENLIELEEWRAEKDRLTAEMTEREAIAETVKETAIEKGYNLSGPLAWWWSRQYDDAMNDAEYVPMEDYEAYLTYRANAAAVDNADEMKRYDRKGAMEERLGLLVGGVAEGLNKAATSGTKGMETILYTLLRKLPGYSDMTKEEIYASNRELAALKGWNEQYSQPVIGEEQKQALQEEYPVFSMISEGVSEVLKMTGQMTNPLNLLLGPGAVNATSAAAGGWQGLMKLQNGGKVAQKIGSMLGAWGRALPFQLDAYSQTYNTALTDGATEDQAAMAGALNALITGSLSSGITENLAKLGGNAMKLFGTKAGQAAASAGAIRAAKNGWMNAVLSLGKSAIEEGFEEAIEEPIQGAISKGVYDRDRAWLGEGGVFDPAAMIESGIGGAIAGPMFAITAGLSGTLGTAAQTKAEAIIEQTLAGEEVDPADIAELTEIESREALIQDTADELKTAAQPEIDAAEEAVKAAQEQTVRAEEKAAEASKQLQATVQESRETIVQPLNDGTMSYEDPETVKKLNEATKKAAAEQNIVQKAEAELRGAQESQQQAEQARDEKIQKIETQARAEATAQVDAALQEEKAQEAARQAEEAEAAKQAEAERPVEPGVKYSNEKLTSLSSESQTQMRILDELGRTYGIEFNIVDSIEGGKANAAYAGGKRITVALDAVEGAYVQAGVHEMIHYVKAQTEAGYAALEATVVDWLKQSGTFDLESEAEKRIAEYAENGQTIDREGAIEEIVAEAIPTIFTDERAAAVMVDRDRTLAEKVRDFFLKFARKIEEIAFKYVERTGRQEIASLSGNADALYDMAQTLDLALWEAGKHGGRTEAAAETQEAAEESTPVTVPANSKLSVNAAQESEDTPETTASAEGSAREPTTPTGQLAKQVAKKWKSTIGMAELADGIDEITDAYEAGESEKAQTLADELARKVIDQSRDKDISHREGYEEIRKRLREGRIQLTDTQMQEVASRYGSYNDYRKSIFGSIGLSKEGTSLDSLWGELNGMHPDMFPADTNEAQMPEVLAEFVQRMKPKYVNPYGMNMEGATADLSMRLQAEILRMIGKVEDAAKLEGDANALRESSRQTAQQKRAAERAAQEQRFREIAAEMAEARRNGDDTGVQTALDKLRQNNRDNAEINAKADAVEIGVQVRRLRADVRRITKMLGNLDDVLGGENSDADRQTRKRLEEEYSNLADMRDQLVRLANRLHRQEVIARAEAANAGLLMEEAEADETIREMLDDALNADMGDALDDLQEDMAERIRMLKARVGARSEKLGKTGYNNLTTLTKAELEETFEDLQEEMAQHAALAKSWKTKKSSAEYHLIVEEKARDSLNGQLRRAKASGDAELANSLREQIEEANDRIAALQSQKKEAERQEQYNRRIGAEGIGQALSEGRLPQPIMERVISLVKESGRKGKLNSTWPMRAIEQHRNSWLSAARVWDDLFGEAAPLMRAIYYDQVMDNETRKQVWIKDWRERIGKYKFNAKERQSIQIVGEGHLNIESVTENLELTAEEASRVQGGVELFRAFYDESYKMAKTVLNRNGYSMGHIPEYFPHFELPKTFFDKIGIPMERTALPTSINGLTDTFSPGHQYSAHLQQRKGPVTDYDALYGFEEYIRTMSDVIYHTDDIQRHRQLESEIRAASAHDPSWPDRDVHGQTYHANEFVKWLHEYANVLAGKKGQNDRGAEGTEGRPIYALANRLKSIRGASAVMGNLSSAVTNFVPVVNALAEHPAAMLKGATMAAVECIQGRQNRPESKFMIRRFGSDSVVQTAYTRFSKGVSKPFELVDAIATNLVVQTYYQQNLGLGMDNETAMRMADAKAARQMGDRSKGAMPNAYNSKLLGFLTQFQYEVANQSQYFRKDIWREKGALKGLITLFMTALMGNLWNQLNEKLTGRRPAADPINMAVEMYEEAQKTGEFLPVMQAAYNNISEMFPYMNVGGRIAATESFVEMAEALTGGTVNDIKYAAANLGWSILPMGGQLKKMKQGAQALIQGGHYSANGKRLYYPLDAGNPWTAAQALLFGKSATEAARDYYSGDAPALTEAQTREYEEARNRGTSATEAYDYVIRLDKASDLYDEAKSMEKAAVNEANRAKDGFEPEDVDTSRVESQREEAAEIRGELEPTSMLSDYWYDRRDTPAVQNAFEIWRKTGEDWAMPYAYDAEKSYTIDGETRWIGPELIGEIDKLYEKGYREIMESVDVSRLDEKGMEELKKRLDKMYKDVNDTAKARIRERR